MFTKLICVIVLIAFVSVQLAQSLQCYQCDNRDDCRSPKKVTCDQTAANRTNTQLRKYFVNVRNDTNNNFECLKTNANQNNNWVMEIRGCTIRDRMSCNLVTNPSAGFYNKNCTVCNTNLCNPAGTFSSSSITILLTLFAGVVAKWFV